MAGDVKILSGLFDLKFDKLITPRVISIIYVIAIILAGLVAIAMIVSGFAQSAGQGLVLLILSPLVFLLYVLAARIYLELVIVIFRIERNTPKPAGVEALAPEASGPTEG